MGSILAAAPLDLVDLLLDFKGFEVVEFGFVRLEFRVELVFASLFLFEVISLAQGQQQLAPTHRLVSLKQNDSSTLVSCREVIARVIELDRRDNIS